MKFTTRCTVVGMKSSKGQMEGGQPYDSTKAYILLDMDASKGRMKGQSCEAFNIGLAGEFDKYSHLPFPFEAEADFEIVTTGNASRTQCQALRPIAGPKSPVPAK